MGVTIVVVTHDPLVSEQVNRTVAIRDGRTSTETLRRRDTSSEGGHFMSEEYAVLDRVGRLQLPHAYMEALGLERRVRLSLEADHITVWPDHTRFSKPISGDGDLALDQPALPSDDLTAEPEPAEVGDDHAQYRRKDGPTQ
jgi:hypothetical protein